ncbi:MAG: PQQ-binding-like beta-propeller repeat protein, partial [Bacteroidetes bacterium]|nr:PQQ-binding-like beta-propeller repeat protein [Bacteroidota bacterium]
MIKSPYSRYVVLFAIAIFILLFAWWLFHDPVRSFTPSLPGMDNRNKGAALPAEKVIIGDSFAAYKSCEDLPGTLWPRFRGADFDNVNKENVRLIDAFGAAGPKILWKISLGEGHAAPAVYQGRVYLLDYDERKRADALRCFSLKTGEELWRRWYHVRLKRNHGLSRTIPAVNEKYVVTIGPKCQVMCVDRLTGNLRWGVDLSREYQTEVPFWYTGQCPLIDHDTAVIAIGGKSLMIGVECKTGKKVWETPNPHQWKMSHSSVMPMTFRGKKMYVYIAIGGVCGISGSGTDKGKILWESAAFSPGVVAPSPVIADNGKIFFTAGYGAGSMLMQLKESSGIYSVTVLQNYKPLEGLTSEQQTPVFMNGYLYGIQPKDAGDTRNQFVCCKSDNCQKFVMTSGKEERFGLGPYLYADNKFFILDDDGELTIAKASPAGFIVLDRKKIIDGQDSWGPLAVTGGYLLMRDSKQLVCL